MRPGSVGFLRNSSGGETRDTRARAFFLAAGIAALSFLPLASCGKKAAEVASLEDVQALEEAADEAGSLAGASVDVDAYLTNRAKTCFGIDAKGLAVKLGAKAGSWKQNSDASDYPGCALNAPDGVEIARIVIGESRVIGANADDAIAVRASSRLFTELVGGAAAGGVNPDALMRAESPGVDIGGVVLPLPLYIGGFHPDRSAVLQNRIGVSVGDFFALVTFADGKNLDAARAAVLELVYPAVQAVHDGLPGE